MYAHTVEQAIFMINFGFITTECPFHGSIQLVGESEACLSTYDLVKISC